MEIDGLSLEPATDADIDLLYEIYAGTREGEMAQLPWSGEEKEAFLRMQFHAQNTFYRDKFVDASFDIVKRHGTPVGRLYVDRRHDEIRIIDIALLPRYRGQGIGGQLLNGILEEGMRADLPVRIHVERNNPALRLYLRLGFRQLEDKEIHYLMEKRPEEI